MLFSVVFLSLMSPSTCILFTHTRIFFCAVKTALSPFYICAKFFQVLTPPKHGGRLAESKVNKRV